MTTTTHESSWNSDTTNALGHYRLLGRIFGIWPLNRSLITTIQVIVLFIINFAMMFVLIKDLIIKGNCGMLKDVIDIMLLIGAILAVVTKISYICVHQKTMCLIITSAVKDWSTPINKNNRKIMLKYAVIGQRVSKLLMYSASIAISVLFYFFPPNFNNIILELNNTNNSPVFRNIPIGPNCWVSQSMSVNWYLIYYFFLSINTYIIGMTFIGSDVYLIGIVMYFIAQFHVLHENIASIDGRESYLILRNKIKLLVQRNCYLFELVDKFKQILNSTLLVQLAVNASMTIFSGILVLIALQNGDMELLISSALRIFINYFQLFMYMYIGEILTLHAGLLTKAYNCSWHAMSPSIIRDLSFIIMRSSYPLELRAGNIYQMNLLNYKNLVRTMFSYFSVLRLILEK